jgi:hypothetical protein
MFENKERHSTVASLVSSRVGPSFLHRLVSGFPSHSCFPLNCGHSRPNIAV